MVCTTVSYCPVVRRTTQHSDVAFSPVEGSPQLHHQYALTLCVLNGLTMWYSLTIMKQLNHFDGWPPRAAGRPAGRPVCEKKDSYQLVSE